MLTYTATDQHGHRVVGDIEDPARSRRDVTVELYARGYQDAAVYDGRALVAGVRTDPNGDRHWWTSLHQHDREPLAVQPAD